VYTIPNTLQYATSGNLALIILLIVEWVMTLLMIGVMMYSIVKDKPHLMKIVSNLVLMR
jgi:uncharacterized protein YqhQ